MPSPKTLQEKQDEKGRLAKHYRFNKRVKWDAFCADEPRILTLQRDIRRMDSPSAILEYLRASWVLEASTDARIYTLRIIDKHANKKALQAGGEALSDPMPPARNLYIAARELLRIR